jgi:hypothetical protein
MAYAPLILGYPGTPACPNKYDAESTLECPRTHSVTVQVSAAAVVLQFGRGPAPGSIVWGPEEPYLPFVGSLARECDQVRVRNLTAGQAAQVVITPR